MLPRISPNIGLQPHAAEPPLAPYLRSLESMAAFDSAEALPAREYRFIGLASRVRMLLAHHLQHLADSGRIAATTDGPDQMEFFAVA